MNEEECQKSFELLKKDVGVGGSITQGLLARYLTGRYGIKIKKATMSNLIGASAMTPKKLILRLIRDPQKPLPADKVTNLIYAIQDCTNDLNNIGVNDIENLKIKVQKIDKKVWTVPTL